MKFLLGKKLGMTTIFDETKGALNVTLIACEENKVKMNRTLTKDGYLAVQLEVKKNAKKTVRKEFRIDKGVGSAAEREALAKELEQYPVDAKMDVSLFEVGDRVHVAGVTKAKGFQGTVKRYGFAGGRKSHGGKHDLRKPGSIGATFPEHVLKGRRMAGRMGHEQVTVKNLKVTIVDAAKGIIAVSGAVPGPKKSIVIVKGAK